MKIILALILSVVVFNNLNAQQTFTKQEFLDDIDSLYVIVNDIHPDMFAYMSQSDFESKVALIKKQIHDNMSLLEFYLLIKPLVTSLGDGHTSISFPWREIMPEEFTHLPLML